LKTLLAILVAFFFATTLWSDDYSHCFMPGESSEYKISWMKIPLAWSKTTVSEVERDGQNLIQIRMISRNYKAYSMIYRVDDLSEVLIDPKTALPVRLEIHIREGSRESHFLTYFQHEKGFAITKNLLTDEVTSTPIQKNTRDIYTLVYAMRNLSIDQLTQQTRTVFVEGKLYNLKLKKGAKKKIRIADYGAVPCVEIEPEAEFDGFFIRKGKIDFWVSEQQPRMITCIKTKVSVGKITVKLQKVSFPKKTSWTKKK
jgi:hypothetical protein